MKQVEIYADGSVLTNPSRSGACALLCYEGFWRAVGEFLPEATNNQAELVAAAIGLELLKEPCEVVVLTDSQYVVNSMMGIWCKGTNFKLWKQLEVAAKPHRVSWQWIRRAIE